MIFSKNGTAVPGNDFSLEIDSKLGLGIGSTGTLSSSNSTNGDLDAVSSEGLENLTGNCAGADVCLDFDSLRDIRINKPTNTDKTKIPQMAIILVLFIFIILPKI